MSRLRLCTVRQTAAPLSTPTTRQCNEWQCVLLLLHVYDSVFNVVCFICSKIETNCREIEFIWTFCWQRSTSQTYLRYTNKKTQNIKHNFLKIVKKKKQDQRILKVIVVATIVIIWLISLVCFRLNRVPKTNRPNAADICKLFFLKYCFVCVVHSFWRTDMRCWDLNWFIHIIRH